MARLMSVALTEDAVRERRKTVTRRLGWRFLKPGHSLTLVRKAMGRKPGEPIVRFADVLVIDVRREPLGDIHWQPGDPTREGFPDWTPAEFVEFFCRHMHCTPFDEVTRIEWRYLPEVAAQHSQEVP